MKNYFTYLFFVSIILVLLSCEGNKTITEAENNKLFAEIFVSLKNSYYDSDSKKTLNIANLDFKGELIGENITAIDYIMVGNDTVPYEDSYSYPRDNWGVINFNRPTGVFIDASFPKRFMVKTKIGSIEGTIIIPDSVKNLSYNKKDSLHIGDSLIVSFEAGDADYFKLNYALFYNLSYNPVANKFGSTITREPRVVIDESMTSIEGVLQISSITAYKGPFPEEGASGNMTGDGSGFLYVLRKQNIYDYFQIVK